MRAMREKVSAKHRDKGAFAKYEKDLGEVLFQAAYGVCQMVYEIVMRDRKIS